jgi:hypothetical protein
MKHNENRLRGQPDFGVGSHLTLVVRPSNGLSKQKSNPPRNASCHLLFLRGHRNSGMI